MNAENYGPDMSTIPGPRSFSLVAPVALSEYFSVTLSLLNLLEKSLGRSKPATRLAKNSLRGTAPLLYTAKIQHRKFETNNLRKGIVRPYI
jgi:hypothetical protein